MKVDQPCYDWPKFLERLAAVEVCVRAEKALREAQLHEMTRALDLARVAMEKRLDGMNEFREALKDQTVRAVTRSEYELAHKVVTDEIHKIEMGFAEREGRSKNIAIVSAIIASILMGVFSTIFSHWLLKP